MSGTLYVVATPIGNIDEITTRALEVLAEVDLIAAEDTRTTKLMMNLLGVKSPKFTSYQKFSEAKKRDSLLSELESGKNIAIVSEAGTPCISDPGMILVRAAADRGIPIVGISGPCAAITAISISGFPAEPYVYLGFIPKKKNEIMKLLDNWLGSSIVFYDSPQRIEKTMDLLADNYPAADVCLCNDMTKRYERIYRGKPADVLEEIQANPSAGKGEYTCVLYLSHDTNEDSSGFQLSLESCLIDIIVKQNCDMKEAIKILSSGKNVTKKEAYAASLRLKELL